MKKTGTRPVLYLFFIRCGFVDRRGPIHADGGTFDLEVTTRTHLQLKGAVLIHFVDRAMNARDGNHLIAFAHLVDELLLLFLFFRLRADEEQPEDQDDHPHENQGAVIAKRTAGFAAGIATGRGHTGGEG